MMRYINRRFTYLLTYLLTYLHSMRKRTQSEKSIKTDTVVSPRIYNQIASDVWETENPVNEFTTDKPQPVLINVLIGAILNT